MIGRVGSQRVVSLSGGLIVAAGIGFALVRFFGEVPPAQNLETAAGAAAFGAVIAAPGVLALLALRDRPALLLPAAMLLVPLSFLSFALVTLPLLIPAFLLVRGFARADLGHPGWRVAATTIGVLALLIAAMAALFVHDDPRHYTTDTGDYSTSDIVTYIEATLSLALTATAIAIAWRLNPPGR